MFFNKIDVTQPKDKDKILQTEMLPISFRKLRPLS